MIEAPERPEVTTKDVSDAMRHAALYIEEYGWTQGTLSKPDGRVCLVGALLHVTGGAMAADGEESLFSHTREALAEYVLLQGWLHGIVAWNDRTDQTKDGVVATLRYAAQFAR